MPMKKSHLLTDLLCMFLLCSGALTAKGNVELLNERQTLQKEALESLFWSENLEEHEEDWVLQVLESNIYRSYTLMEKSIDVVLEHDIERAIPILTEEIREIPPGSETAVRHGLRGQCAPCREMAVEILKSKAGFETARARLSELRRLEGHLDALTDQLRDLNVVHEIKRVRRGEIANLTGLDFTDHERLWLDLARRDSSSVIAELIPKIAKGQTSQKGITEVGPLRLALATYGSEAAQAIVRYLGDPQKRKGMTALGKLYLLKTLKENLFVLNTESLLEVADVISALKKDTRVATESSVSPADRSRADREISFRISEIREGLHWLSEGIEK